MFQERIPVKEGKERVLGEVTWQGCSEHSRAPGRGKAGKVTPQGG